jgi:hypothetical protein
VTWLIVLVVVVLLAALGAVVIYNLGGRRPGWGRRLS